jgi:hypothetical protein
LLCKKQQEEARMNMHKWTQTMSGGERAVEAFMAALEAIFVSIIGRVAVWFTPLPSAVLVARSATRVFELGGLLRFHPVGTFFLLAKPTKPCYTYVNRTYVLASSPRR